MGVHLNEALMGIDTAVWDCVAKKARKSCAELWGCNDDAPIPVYASSISRALDPSELADALMKVNAKTGISAFKVKIGKRMGGTTLEEDRSEEIFAAIDAAAVDAGMPHCLVAFDANGGFDRVDAARGVTNKLISVPRKCAEVWFMEEPFIWFDHSKSLQYKQGCKDIVIAGGEQEFRFDVWKRLYSSSSSDAHPFDICQPDVGYCGGPSVALSIAAILLAHKSVKFVPHSPQPDYHFVTSFHLLAAAPNAFSHIECACVDDGICQMPIGDDGTSASPIFCAPFYFRDGAVEMPSDGYGWGVRVRSDFIAECVARRSGAPSSIGFSPPHALPGCSLL